MLAEAAADAWLKDALDRALEANECRERLAAEFREENERLRERDAQREAELERLSAELAVLHRLVFGRSSERARPDAPGGGDVASGQDRDRGGGGGRQRGRGLGGGITRICPGSRWSGIFSAAGTAARGAWSRSRAWAIMSWSSWTGR